jgi:hypothetical protein
MEPVVYRVAEFCRVYAISKASFYREIQAGRLRLVKRGKRSLVERHEAERWFTALKNPPVKTTQKTKAGATEQSEFAF